MALRLDATSSQYLAITSGALDNSGSFTVCGWFRRLSGTNRHVFNIMGGTRDWQHMDVVFVDSSGNWKIEAIVSYNVYSATGGACDTDVDYFIALVRSGSASLKLYVDGALECEVTDDVGGRPSATWMQLGSYYDGGPIAFSDGRFSGWKAWSRALTQEELDGEALSKLPKSVDSLYGYWPLAPGASRPSDYSGNGHNWTEINSPTDEADPPVAWGESQVVVGGSAQDSSISGTSGGVASTSGTLSGPASGSGSSAGSASVSGTATGDLQASGSSSGSATTSGALSGGGSASGSSAGVATTSGAIDGSGAITATSAGAATTSGTLTGAGGSTGSTTGTATTSGTLTGGGALTATAGGTTSTSATLTATASMSGSATGTATTGGSLAEGSLVGTTAGEATTEGELTATWDMVAADGEEPFVVPADAVGTLTGEILTTTTYGRWVDPDGNVVAPEIPAGSQWRIVLTGPAADQPCAKVTVVMLERNRP